MVTLFNKLLKDPFHYDVLGTARVMDWNANGRDVEFMFVVMFAHAPVLAISCSLISKLNHIPLKARLPPSAMLD